MAGRYRRGESVPEAVVAFDLCAVRRSRSGTAVEPLVALEHVSDLRPLGYFSALLRRAICGREAKVHQRVWNPSRRRPHAQQRISVMPWRAASGADPHVSLDGLSDEALLVSQMVEVGLLLRARRLALVSGRRVRTWVPKVILYADLRAARPWVDGTRKPHLAGGPISFWSAGPRHASFSCR